MPQPGVLVDGLNPDKRAALRRQRVIATACLVVAALALVGSYFLPAGLWAQALRATAEAALVGGLADWFAVTALFRHPLGIPVWHTAIIPRRKDRIGAELGAFVADRFLADDVLLPRLRDWGLAERLAGLLAEPAQRDRVARQVGHLVPHLARLLLDPDVRAALAGAARRGLARIDWPTTLADLLQAAMAEPRFAALVDTLLDLLRDLLAGSRPRLTAAMADELPRYTPNMVRDKLADVALFVGRQVLEDLAAPDGAGRARLMTGLQDLARRLREDQETRLWVAGLLDRLIGDHEIGHVVARVLDDLHRRLGDPDGGTAMAIRQAAADGLVEFGQRLRTDADLRQRLDDELQALIARLAHDLRPAIARLIADTVSRWDNAMVVEQAELAIGRDLQFVRINGTVVGGLIGLLIFALEATLIH